MIGGYLRVVEINKRVAQPRHQDNRQVDVSVLGELDDSDTRPDQGQQDRRPGDVFREIDERILSIVARSVDGIIELGEGFDVRADKRAVDCQEN